MDRRHFLRLAGASGLSLFTPRLTMWPSLGAWGAGDSSSSPRVLVLVELKGGNDGLNTLIPFRDAEYYKLRPRLAVPRDQVIRLDDHLGFNPALSPLTPAWESQELAIVRGVGYPSPNRSHFRSIEIWETGSDSDQYRDDGWVARTLGTQTPSLPRAADGVILSGEAGPLAGPNMRNVAFRDPRQFTRRARRVRDLTEPTDNPALEHLLAVRSNLREAARIIEEKHARAPSLRDKFPASDIGRQLQTAAELILSQVPLAVIKVSHGSFDTHSGQRGTHDRLLTELGAGLAAFRQCMAAGGPWAETLLLTYSEFGRRPAENGSGGTDHGTAAPHFVMGGNVRGGMYGKQPSLTNLRERDLQHHVDYRCLYSTVAKHWWNSAPEDASHAPLPLIRTRVEQAPPTDARRESF